MARGCELKGKPHLWKETEVEKETREWLWENMEMRIKKGWVCVHCYEIRVEW